MIPQCDESFCMANLKLGKLRRGTELFTASDLPLAKQPQTDLYNIGNLVVLSLGKQVYIIQHVSDLILLQASCCYDGES